MYYKNMADLRRHHQLTQAEAGARIGVSKQKWGDYERAYIFPSAKHLGAISREFGVGFGARCPEADEVPRLYFFDRIEDLAGA